MEAAQGTILGRVGSIGRYPVKSMLGESLEVADVTERGLRGDRAFAMVDVETGKVVSAKNPRRWPDLFTFRAAFAAPFREGGAIPPARITLPDGATLDTDQPDVEARLSAAVGRPVRLARSAFRGATGEGYWPDHDWLPTPDATFDVPLPEGTFFDGAMVHLLTTATLDRLHALGPASRFDVRRFRPNFVIEPEGDVAGFVEDGWIGRTLAVGGARLRIDRPCPRCVMTTLPQDDLPKDPGVLRTVVQQHAGDVGVYASVVQGGPVARGDVVRLE